MNLRYTQWLMWFEQKHGFVPSHVWLDSSLYMEMLRYVVATQIATVTALPPVGQLTFYGIPVDER